MQKQQVFMYLLCVSVLFTMGMDFGTEGNYYSDTASQPSVLIKTPIEQVSAFLPQPRTKAITENLDHSILELEQHNRPLSIERPIQEVAGSDQYEVTAYYLNVRADKNVASDILNVVKKGDILEVLETTDNNWLKLKTDGYVHGKYAELMRENEQHLVPQNPSQPTQQSPNIPTTIVESDSQLTKEQIEQIFQGTSLADHGLEQTILETEEEYGINAYFTIAVMKLESGHGKSKLAKEKNNLFGLNAIDGDAYNKAFSFKTKGESVEKFGQLISENYVDKGYTSIEKVASKYCQANPKWSALVMKIMKNDYKKLSISKE